MSHRDDWRRELASGLVAGDVSVHGVARYAHVSLGRARDVIDEATRAGLLEDGAVDDRQSVALTALLTPTEIAEVRGAAALHLLAKGPASFPLAVEHGRAAADLIDQPALERMLIRSGRLAMSTGACSTAADLLRAALDIEHGMSLVERARVMIDLARAEDRCGHRSTAEELRHEVARLAESAQDPVLLLEAAIETAFPPDWRAGDGRASALLAAAERLSPDGPRTAALLATRAMVEMRIPAPSSTDHEIAWVTRASIAQPMADDALAMTDGCVDADRLIALIAWRSTHRAPAHLTRRLQVSREAMDLAQRRNELDRLVDCAIALATDALEAGDRTGYDEALGVARWAAHSERHPRALWWTETVSAGAALLDGDVDLAMAHRATANELGREFEIPGWIAADIVLDAEIVMTRDDDDEIASLLLPESPLLVSPLARSTVALVAARLGEAQIASHHARIAIRAIDEESSYLFCHTLLARAAAGAGDAELVRTCEDRLLPWSGRMAVDASCWWCLGPVDLALAELAASCGRSEQGSRHLDSAWRTARAVGDVRSEARIATLLADPGLGLRLTTEPRAQAEASSAALMELTDRERDVLALLASGLTNAAIGQELSFSTSTIRADTVSIYRKLGVQGRVEAAALAATLSHVSRRT